MASQLPWLRVLLEGMVIVGSILLALAADAWWDEREERRAEHEAILGLDADFSENLADLHGGVAQHEGYVQRLARLENMSDVDRRAVSEDSMLLFVEAMAVPATFQPRDGTLDALLASGRLDIIKAPGLRDGLVGWKSLIDDTEEEATRLYDAAVSVNERLLRLGSPWSWRPVVVAATPGLGEVRSRLATADLETLAGDAELVNRVHQKLWLTAVYLQELRFMVRHAESVLAMTEAYFGDTASIVGVSIEETPFDLAVGTSFSSPPRAWAEFSDGRRRRVELEASWSSSDTSVADALTAYRPGQADLCATYRGIRGCATVTVRP